MAKKETNLTYLQVPLPSAIKKAKMVKKSWSGYNRRQTVDTGMLAVENNVSTAETPYFTPCEKAVSVSYGGGYTSSDNSVPIGIFGFTDFFIVIYGNKTDKKILIDYVKVDDKGKCSVYTETLKTDATDDDFKQQRCVVPFNVYDITTDPVEGEYIKKLLIFPDKLSINYDVANDGFEKGALINTPDIKYATVHLSRLFGVDDVRVYASAFNDYANWNLDTAEEYNESNAWCSSSGANVKAGGEFTGITTFQNHVICFKKDFMHEIYNTKNPFRIQDIYAEGCIDNRTIQDVDGQLIFVSDDNVKVYTGSNPRILSYYLGIREFNDAVAGTDGRNYYLYCRDENNEKHIFVYDTYCNQWSRRECPSGVVGFAKCDSGMYFLCESSSKCLYKIQSGNYDEDWYFETDLITNESCNIKHIEKLQMFCDIEEGATMKVSFIYDDETEKHTVWNIAYASEDMQKVIRVKPRMTACHGFKIRVEGSGFVRIRTMELLIQGGGDLYV